MVRPIIGNPAGQWATHNGVVAVLTYFNGARQGKEPDGYVCILFINTTSEKRVVEIGLSVTYSGDAFFDSLVFREILPAGIVVERECYREQLKLATWTMVAFRDPDSGRYLDLFDFQALAKRGRAASKRNPSRVMDSFMRKDPKWLRWLEQREKEAAVLPPYEPDSLTVIDENFAEYAGRKVGRKSNPMTVMIAEFYDALRSAGADDEKARKAAEAVAESRSEMNGVEAGLRSGMHGIRVELQGVRGEIATLKWRNGGLLAVAVAIFIRILFG